jgi:Concanavalin A-like lectin/glucanases superfamily/Secretion system C-terminal sorting domain/F5/8 type C domain
MKAVFTFLLSSITLFSFAQIPSGTALWLKADAGVTLSGSNVTQWADQSGNGYNVTQATAANQPTFETNVFNGQPAINFDGSNDFLNNITNNVVMPGAGRTVFIVAKARCNSTAMYYLTFRRSTLLCAYQSSPGTNFIYSDGVNGINNATYPSNWWDTIKAKPTLLTAYNSGVAPNKINLRLNQQTVTVSQGGGVVNETGTAGFSVGRREDGPYFSNGWIAEIIVYNSELSSTDRTTVENYLAAKYGTNNSLPVAAVSTNKPITASSTYGPSPQPRGVDDNACTDWSSGTFNGVYTIDLLNPVTIDKIFLAMFQSPTGSFGAGCKIEVSTNNSTWVTAVDLSGIANPASYTQHKFQLPSAIPNIRYVRANMPGNSSSWISIGELSVNPDLINREIKNITPLILNSDGSFNNGNFIAGETYYCSKASTYQWKRNNVNISGATNQIYIPTQPGNYTCTVTYECSAGCNAVLTSTGSYTGLPANATPTCALQLNGTTAGVNIPDNNAMEPTTAFTYEAWFKGPANRANYRQILTKGGSPANYAITMGFDITNGNFVASSVIGGTLKSTSTTPLDDNNWHHAALTYNGSVLTLYIDGNIESTVAATGAVITNGNILKIANFDNDATPFAGSIDEVRIWNIARTQTEIQDKLDEVLIGNEAGLIAYYNFNDNLFNGQNRLVPNKCTTTGSILNGTTFGSATVPSFSCAAAAFAEPDCTMGLVNTGDIITVPHAAALSTNTFTVAAYVRTNQAATPFARILTKPAGTLQQNYSLCINNGKAHIRFDHSGGAAQAEGTTNINDNAWHYIAGTYDGTNLRIYVDGTLQATTAITATAFTSTQNLEIGQYAGSQQFIGRMDQIAVYNIALIQAQIQGNIGYNLLGSETGLVAYYNFNDNRINGTGQTVINKATATGAALNGTTNGNATTPTFSCSEVLPNRPACSIMFSSTEASNASKVVKLNANNNFTIELIAKPQGAQYIGPNSTTNTGLLFGKKSAITASGAVWPGNTSGLNVAIARNGIEVWEQNGFYNHQGRLGYYNTIDLQDWVHVAISCNNGALKLYINGVPVSSAVATGVNYTIYPLFGGYFGGNISEARFWDRTLTGAEINSNVNTVFTGSETDLRALYRFNSNTANGAGQTITGLGPLGSTNPLTTGSSYANSQMPIFTCAGYIPNTTSQAKDLPGSGDMVLTGALNGRGVANLNSWGNLPNMGTISFWFKAVDVNPTSPTQNIFSTAPLSLDKGGNKGIRIELNGTGQLNAIFGNDNSTTLATTNSININGSQTIVANKWYHVALSFDRVSNTVSSYLNGITTNTNIANTLWPTAYRDINVGMGYAYANSHAFINSLVDELTHYNIQLTETQVRERMARKLTNADALWANVLNYYRFDNNSGISPVIYDYKGTNHGMYFDFAGGTLSEAPIGDVSSFDYNGNSSTTNLSVGASGADVVTATMSAGNAAGLHVYGETQLPNIQTGVNLPLAGNDRYAGVFVVNPDAAARYTLRYDYTNNPNVNATNEPQLKLFKRDNNAVTTWVQANNLSLNQASNYLECTGQFTEYILGENATVLSLNLLSFHATKINNKVYANWKTADEINVDKFIVERSTDGQRFNPIATTLAKNTNGTHNYGIIDEQLPLNNGILYYRLKQVDLDGKTVFSQVVKIILQKGNLISIYPNPATDFININTTEQIKNVFIANVTGQTVAVFAPNTQNKYNISNLPSGIYFVNMQTNNQIIRQKIIKQ